MRTNILAIFLLATVSIAHAQSLPAQSVEEKITQSFDLSAPFSPAPIWIDGKRLLRYELHLTSFTVAPLTLQRIEIVDAITGTPLAEFEGERLAGMVRAVASDRVEAATLVVEPGKRSVAYFNLDTTGKVLPASISHRVTFLKRDETVRLSGGTVAIDRKPPPRFGPPLAGGPWTAIYLPETDGGHRRFIYAIGGKARIPGRFAIDWMPAPGNPGTGADVLAVADAKVVAVHDGVPQPVAGQPKQEVSSADEAGNYVILALPDGRYVHYQHMMPGLRVKLGERVRRGQLLGRVGSTGQVTAPHLHLHVSDGLSLLGSEGVPFALSGGTVVGTYISLSEAEAAGTWRPVEAQRLGTAGFDVPPPLSVVRFE